MDKVFKVNVTFAVVCYARVVRYVCGLFPVYRDAELFVKALQKDILKYLGHENFTYKIERVKSYDDSYFGGCLAVELF